MTQIRIWARDQGYVIGERGRLPVHVIEAYQHAHPSGRGAFDR